jgi:uncharacterized membrane protein
MRALAIALRVLATLAYPFAVYLGVTRWGPRAVGLAVLALALPRALLAARGARREDLAHALRVPLTIGALALCAAILRDARFVLAMPVLVNLALLAQFASSLRGETPLVERFARMQVATLSEPERAWCRSVTVAWCVFFALNALTAATLALAAPVAWWTLFTGVLSYLLLGAMFTVEYVLRSMRFRRYGSAPHDRLMARLFPPRSDGEARDG